MLKITNLTKYYSDTKALDEVSFTVKAGEITGFLGPNGAGKTTTMRIATGFLNPDDGTVKYNGKSLKLNSDTIISDIGYLPENNPQYDNLRVDESLIFTAKFKDAHDLKKIREIAEKCGIEKVLDKEISTLSKGYKQRVGLAKALIGDPKYLILDEPTEGLDPNQKEDILKLIRSFSKDKIILFSSHILTEVSQIADKIIVINEGKIVAEGNKDDLVKEHFKNARISICTEAKVSELKTSLKDIKNVLDIKKVSNSREKFSLYDITCKNPEVATLEIFDTIVKNNWHLKHLEIKSQGLEELFKELTK